MRVFTNADGEEVALDPGKADTITQTTLRGDQVQAFAKQARDAKERADREKTPESRAEADRLANIHRLNCYRLVINGQAHTILTEDTLAELTKKKKGD